MRWAEAIHGKRMLFTACDNPECKTGVVQGQDIENRDLPPGWTIIIRRGSTFWWYDQLLCPGCSGSYKHTNIWAQGVIDRLEAGLDMMERKMIAGLDRAIGKDRTEVVFQGIDKEITTGNRNEMS